jgi:excisionase family DNA binding protein
MDNSSAIPGERAFSIQDVATMLGVSTETIKRKIRERTLGYLKIGRRVSILEIHVQDFIARSEVTAV